MWGLPYAEKIVVVVDAKFAPQTVVAAVEAKVAVQAFVGDVHLAAEVAAIPAAADASEGVPFVAGARFEITGVGSKPMYSDVTVGLEAIAAE